MDTEKKGRWAQRYTGVGGYSLRQERTTLLWWLFDHKNRLVRANMGANRAGIEWAFVTHPEGKKYGRKALDVIVLVPRRGKFKHLTRPKKRWKLLCPEVVGLLVGVRYPRQPKRLRDPQTGRYYTDNPIPDEALGIEPR